MSAQPVTFVLQPLWLQAHFKKSIKFQIAIFRMAGTGNDRKPIKMDKTRPKQVSNQQEKIPINGSLRIPTTLPSNQDKQIDFELAVDIDGRKNRLGKRISIRASIDAFGQTQHFDFTQYGVKLFFKSQVEIDKQPLREGGIEQFKSMKRVKMEDYEPDENQDGNGGDSRGIRATVASSKAILEPANDVPIRRANKCKSVKILSIPDDQEQKQVVERQKMRGGGQAWKDKSGNLQQKYDKLKAAQEQNSAKYEELEKKNRQLQRNISTIKKELMEREEEEKKRLQKHKKEWQFQMQMLKEQNQELKNETGRLQKTAANYQQSTKNIAAGSEAETKMLKDKIRQLQRSQAQALREAAFSEQSINDKDDIISGLKARVLQLDNQREELECRVKAVEEKGRREREELESQKAELQTQVEELKSLRKTSPRTPRALMQGKQDEKEIKDLKKRVQTLEKQLQRKQESIKKLKESQQSDGSSKESQQALKAEIEDLRTSMQHMKKAQSQPSSIEARVHLEKIRKEVEWLRRAEKNLLIEKGQLEGANKQLREEVVKNKMSIAMILNAIQDTGDEKLISEVYSLTE